MSAFHIGLLTHRTGFHLLQQSTRNHHSNRHNNLDNHPHTPRSCSALYRPSRTRERRRSTTTPCHRCQSPNPSRDRNLSIHQITTRECRLSSGRRTLPIKRNRLVQIAHSRVVIFHGTRLRNGSLPLFSSLRIADGVLEVENVFGRACRGCELAVAVTREKGRCC